MSARNSTESYPAGEERLDQPSRSAALAAALGSASTAEKPESMNLGAVCDYIERTYHDPLREELPRLAFLARKVSAAHGEHDPRLQELRRVFEIFGGKMTAHSDEEEQVVFPIIRRLEKADHPAMEGSLADLKAAFVKLESEHDGAGAALARFRVLTDDYTPPDWACSTLRALYEGLERLERDTHQHVHIENDILFPKALAAA